MFPVEAHQGRLKFLDQRNQVSDSPQAKSLTLRKRVSERPETWPLLEQMIQGKKPSKRHVRLTCNWLSRLNLTVSDPAKQAC